MMIYLLLIANWLGSTEYGYIAAAYAAATLSSFLFNWGFNEWMMKVGSTDERPEALGGEVVFLKTILGFFWGILIWIILRNVRPELYLGSILLLTILDVWFDSIFGSMMVIFLLTERVRLGSILLVTSRAIRLLLGISLIIWLQESNILVIAMRLAGTITMTLIAWFLAKPHIVKPSMKALTGIFKKSRAFNISELLNLVYWYADVNILSFLGADPQLIGNYSIVINLINAIIMLPLGMYNVLLPTLVRTFQENRPVFSRQIKTIFISFILLGFTLWAGDALLSRPVITAILGDSYISSVHLLIQLGPLLTVRTLNQANIAYLISVGWQSKRIIPQIVAVAGKVAFGLSLTIWLGVSGMIVTSIGSEVLLAVGYLIQILKHQKGLAEELIS